MTISILTEGTSELIKPVASDTSLAKKKTNLAQEKPYSINSPILCNTFIGLKDNGEIKQVGGCSVRAESKQILRHLNQVAKQLKLLRSGEYEIVETKI